jgi:hypothetical protein
VGAAVIVVIAFVIMESATLRSPDEEALDLVEELVALFNEGDAGGIEEMVADNAVASLPGTWGREMVRTSFEERLQAYVEYAAAVGSMMSLVGCEADTDHALYDVAVSCRFEYHNSVRESLEEVEVGGTIFVGVVDEQAAAVITAQHGVGDPLYWSTERYGFDRWLGSQHPEACLAMGGRLRFVRPECADYTSSAAAAPLLLELAAEFAAVQ